MNRFILCIVVALVFGAQSALAIDPRDRTPRPPEANEEVSSRSETAQPQRRTLATPGSWLIEWSDSAVWFADQTRIERRAGLVQAWITMVYQEELTGVGYVVGLAEYDCAGGRARNLGGAHYARSGRFIQDVQRDSFAPTIPGSVNDSIRQTVCSDFSRWGSDEIPVAPVPDGLTVQVAAANFFRARVPNVTVAHLVGRWTDSNDCSKPITIFGDGSYALSNGDRGRWSLNGSRINFSINGASTNLEVEWIDQNRVRVTNPDGVVGFSTRC
jgi:hypothetical protein